MFFLKLIRFLSGYVSFTCTGGFPERFINLCSLNGITLWDTRTTENGLTAKTYSRCFKKIRPCIRRSGMKIRITEKNGLPFIAAPYLRRKGLVAGTAAGVLLVLILSNFIWTIDVKGNRNFTPEQILDLCAEHGVYAGAAKSNIDVYRVRNDIKTQSDDISWFAVNIYGTNASVELTERLAKTDIIDKDSPCNILSDVDGEIVEIQTLSGQPEVKIGTAVKKGDLLISGVAPRQNGTFSFVHARGTAIVRTNRLLQSPVTKSITVKKTEKSKKVFTLSIFGFDIRLSGGSTECAASYSQSLSFRGRKLPVILTREIHNITQTQKITLTYTEMKLLACHGLMKQEMEIMTDAETEKKTVSVTSEDNCIIAKADIINHEKTGIEKFFEISEE